MGNGGGVETWGDSGWRGICGPTKTVDWAWGGGQATGRLLDVPFRGICKELRQYRVLPQRLPA